MTDSVVSAAGAATAVHAAPLLETERSPSASVAHAAAADRTTQDSKKRAREQFGTPPTSKPLSDDMAVEEGVITLAHVPPDGGSMDSSAVDHPGGGINLDDSVSDG